MNAENGSAIFGKQGSGQIVIDPVINSSTNKANGKIYSTDFWINYGQDGLPTSYSRGNERNQGLLIDLVEPEIRFGNGNFAVSSDGILTAIGGNFSGVITATGGKIANWKIEENRLSTDNGNIYLNSNPNSGEYLIKIGNKFNVSKDGTLSASGGKFSGTITASSISGTTISGGSIDINDGVFKVDSDGNLIATSAEISGSITGSSISGSSITGGNISGSNIIGGRFYNSDQKAYITIGNNNSNFGDFIMYRVNSNESSSEVFKFHDDATIVDFSILGNAVFSRRRKWSSLCL